MLDVKLFRLINDKALELKEDAFDTEKSLQNLFEQNLDSLLGVYFLETEYSTGSFHGGRIDTLGIDANNNPVIIEYKKSYDYNVINQGLYYLEWLLDHTEEFRAIVARKMGQDKAVFVNFANPRLLCISKDFNKFDYSAIQHINKNVELVKYKKYQNDVIYIEMLDPKNILKKTVKNNFKAPEKKPEQAQEKPVDDKFQSKKLKVIEFIMKRGGTVTKTEFAEGCRGFNNRREREDVINHLLDANKLEVIKVESVGAKPKTVYRIVK